MNDYLDLVARVKADLVVRGVNLTGPCGAFEITGRVAWLLREDGFGLVGKSASQAGCPVGDEKYASDAIMLRDGTTFDLLINAGGDEDRNGLPIAGTGNGPAWNVTGSAPVSSWRPPFALDAPSGPAVDPTIPLNPPILIAPLQDLASLTAAIERLTLQVQLLRAEVIGIQEQQARGLTGSIRYLGTVTLRPPS